jgi:hypothetical protein
MVQSVEVLPFQETAAARALPARPSPKTQHTKNRRIPIPACDQLVIFYYLFRARVLNGWPSIPKGISFELSGTVKCLGAEKKS